MIQTNYVEKIILQKLARERFNNASGGEQMKASSGFSGFGGRPDIEDDEYDSDRDRSRGELFHFPYLRMACMTIFYKQGRQTTESAFLAAQADFVLNNETYETIKT